MIFTNSFIIHPQSDFQAHFNQLYGQMMLLHFQTQQIQTRNELLQTSLRKMDQKIAEISQLKTEKQFENQSFESKSGSGTFRKKTNKINPSENQILLDQKQNSSIQKWKQQNKKSKKICNNFTCPYDQCQRIYKSSFSLNLHIKIHHKGGSKRQRQKYASLILKAEEKGEKVDGIPITLPPGFLEEFRSNFEYMKKYKM